MNGRRVVLLSTTFLFAGIDLVHKSFVPADFHHARTRYVVLVMLVLITSLVVLVPRVPSGAAALGAGIACGGALGNLLSVLLWEKGVPDPFVITGASYGLAFNLADVFAVCGDALLLSGVILYGMQNRHRLRERV